MQLTCSSENFVRRQPLSHRGVCFIVKFKNIFHFIPFRYKIGLMRTLIDRPYKINNTSSGSSFQTLSNVICFLHTFQALPQQFQHLLWMCVKGFSSQLQANISTLDRRIAVLVVWFAKLEPPAAILFSRTMSAIQMSRGYAQQNFYSANGVQVKNETACQKGGKIIQ